MVFLKKNMSTKNPNFYLKLHHSNLFSGLRKFKFQLKLKRKLERFFIYKNTFKAQVYQIYRSSYVRAATFYDLAALIFLIYFSLPVIMEIIQFSVLFFPPMWKLHIKTMTINFDLHILSILTISNVYIILIILS